MNLQTLPNQHSHEELFFSKKQLGEDLGLTTVSINELNFDTIDGLPHSIKTFFEQGIHKKCKGVMSYSLKRHKKYREYQQTLEDYSKAVWLTKDFISLDSFRNPIGVHWNPRINKWNIHPGGTRQRVIYHFEKNKEINVLGFNTNAKPIKFSRKFFSVEEIQEYFNASDVALVCTSDYGSIIPHIHFDYNKTYTDIFSSIKHLQDFYKTTKLITNFDMADFGYTEKIESPRLTVKLTVDDPSSADNITRALLLLPSFKNFNDYGVKIECT
jgi:hypothetical protein